MRQATIPPTLPAVYLAVCTVAVAVGGCASRVPASTPDATVRDASPADTLTNTLAADAAGDSDVPSRVRTCSELSVTGVDLAPGHGGVTYPGARVVIHGTDLGTITSVSVGGVDRVFTRAGEALVTDVPPLLAVGPQPVVVASPRCSAAVTITVSRVLARVPVTGGHVTLLDAEDLSPAGSLETGLGAVVQAVFPLDGSALVARGADGAVVFAPVNGSSVVRLAARAEGPFVLAQGTTVPTAGLLVIPAPTPAGLYRLDTLAGTAGPFPGPATDPLGVATSLDGDRALVLDRDGVLYALDAPFGAAPAWSRYGPVTAARAPASVLVAQGAASTVLGAVYDAATPPAVIPLDADTGAVGPPAAVPGALGHAYFLSDDIVAMDSAAPEVLVVDITGLVGTVLRYPLAGEVPAGVVRTTTAAALYQVGALALRATPGGVPQADVLHVLDFRREPPVGETAVPVPGARGLVGVQGRGDPLYIWTGRSVIRVSADAPADRTEAMVPVGEPDVGLLAIQP